MKHPATYEPDSSESSIVTGTLIFLLVSATTGLGFRAYGPVFVDKTLLMGWHVTLALSAAVLQLASARLSGRPRSTASVIVALLLLTSAAVLICRRHFVESDSWFVPVAIGLVFAAIGIKAGRPGLRRLGWGLILLPSALQLLFMSAVGHSVTFLYSRTTIAILVPLELILLLAATRVSLNYRHLAFAMVLAANVWLFPIVVYDMWRPPPAESCELVSQRSGIRQLAPLTRQDGISQPYDIQFIPEEDLFIATTKMAGNLIFDAWNDQSANGIYAIRITDITRPQIRYLPLTGPTLPENITYLPQSRAAAFTRLGARSARLSAVGLDRFPDLYLRFDEPTTGEVVVPLSLAGGRTIGALTVNSVLLSRDSNAGPLRQIPLPGVPGVTFGWQHPAQPVVYATNVSRRLVEVNIRTGAVRKAAVPSALGQVQGVTETGELFQTDKLFRKVHVIDRETMQWQRSIDLPFTPRDLVADASRNLLIVPDWFDGDIHFFELDTLDKLPVTTHAGPYVRAVALDADRNLLLAGSKCGIYAIDLAEILPN